MTAAVIVFIRGDATLDDVTMTRTINPDGTIGPVGGIPEKIDGAVAAQKARAHSGRPGEQQRRERQGRRRRRRRSCALARVRAHNTSSDGSMLRVRIGINAGEPLEQDRDVLVTGTVRDLTLGKGFAFEDRGTVRLKGFAEAQRIYALDP